MSELKKWNLVYGLQTNVITIDQFFAHGGEVAWLYEERKI